MKIIGYVFEADTHCVNCAKNRTFKKVFRTNDTYKRFDEHGIALDATDKEGNAVTPIFSTDEQLEPLHCGDCRERIA